MPDAERPGKYLLVLHQAEYSLMPVAHQPDFANASLVPVEHDPFSDPGPTQQAQFRELQPQARQAPEFGPQQSTTGAGRLHVGPAARIEQTSEQGNSRDPDSATNATSTPEQPLASTLRPDKPPPELPHFVPLGELKPATFTPTQQIGHRAIDALTAFGVPLRNAQELATRIGNLLGLTASERPQMAGRLLRERSTSIPWHLGSVTL